ncbi:mucin-2 [Platichthys flesus]|uniref:mucin-2 n=1 Tax=Platichthys flesus TaxID=8260 RepID=UPI002DB5BCC2|nr:mucin-2 [Platichthys flesus]XP_062234614.1 mucin-2 [Platichthys flesus]
MQQYAEERGLLGKLCPGDKKLEGKNFYLDNLKKRATALLLEAISLLGGSIESFLHKDVSFVVTGSQEGLQEEKSVVTKGWEKGTNEETQQKPKSQSVLISEKQQPVTPRPMACGSRGKALLEKAIRNNERLQRDSVLASARSWGVKILFVDDVILYLKQLTRESFDVRHRKPERTYAKPQSSPVVKAAALRTPYLKIEDSSRKYKPLHMQSTTFPSLCYSGRFSPFDIPPPRFENQTEEGESKTRETKKVESSIQDQSQTPLPCNPAPWRPRKKETAYCESCHQPFTNLEEHLQSDQHRMFVLDPSNYTVVDQLVAEMLPGFNPSPPEQPETTEPPSLQLIQDVCELEPLTDGEVERAIQALRRKSSSSIILISSSTEGPLTIDPGRPSLGVLFPIASPATPPADIQPFTPTECQHPDIHPSTLSPAMPLLDVKPQNHASPSQQPSSCPDTPDTPSDDPYSLPPVLSPQIPSCIMELHSPYSEPPVLSPQQYIEEETLEVSERDTAECLLESVSAVTVPITVSLSSTAAETNAEVEDGCLAFSGILFSGSGLVCDKLVSCQSQSLPRQSATAQNPKKRCRSANPESNHSKRSRITGKCNRTEQGFISIKPERDIMATCGGYSVFDKASCQITQCPRQQVSSSCTGEKLDLTTICVPTVQNFPWEPGHNNAHVTTPSNTKTFEPQLQLPYENSHTVFSRQDSQRSLSHSTSVCIESALIPDLAALSPSSSDSDWECDLLSRLGPTSATPLLPSEQSCGVDMELLHKPCTWMQDTSYESRLHTALQPATPTTSLCGDEMDPSVFSRTVIQIVQVQH